MLGTLSIKGRSAVFALFADFDVNYLVLGDLRQSGVFGTRSAKRLCVTDRELS